MSMDNNSKTAWISQGFEGLVDRVRKTPEDLHFDVLIVGSGYGGAMAACTLAGRTIGGRVLNVGVLERGKEYLPGSFPSGLAELPRHVRRDGNKEGLFDVRIGPEVTTVVANGVGGGSLINAGVLEIPLESVFQKRWPRQLSSLGTWMEYFERARELLGGGVPGDLNTIQRHPDGPPEKYQAIRKVAPSNFRDAAITVAMGETLSSGHVRLSKCRRCGDCATGCNFGAKNSLDVNLLVAAQQRGAEIFSGATVLSIEPGNGFWIVSCVYTNATLRARDREVLRVRASKVIVAAGTLGSFEIMKRSQELGLPLSTPHLGNHCSTNGDMLITDYATSASVNTVANEAVQPSKRAIGPTITGVIDLRQDAGVLIEELSVPASLRIAFTEIFSTVNALHSLDQIDWTKHNQGFPNDDIYITPAGRVQNSAVYAVMADDGAAGHLELDAEARYECDGTARMRWDELPDHPVFDKQVKTLAELIGTSGGRMIPNPFWKLLPDNMSWLLQNKRGPLTTVHPLGGCTMGNCGGDGVVDHLGRVFSTDDDVRVHDGLVVLDGSIVPTALGTNPALTIAAIALRAAENLADNWGYQLAPQAGSAVELSRPIFRDSDRASSEPGTAIECIERLVGPVPLRGSDGSVVQKIVEITLRFEKTEIAKLISVASSSATLKVSETSSPSVRSMIRIYPVEKWNLLQQTWAPSALKEDQFDEAAEFSAPLTGTLRIFERQATWVVGRIWRAGRAWLLNRGLRDVYQALVDGDGGPGFWQRLRSGLAIASRSGEIRAFVYELEIGQPDRGPALSLDDHRIIGTKRFTYERSCNPWRQLMEVALERFPAAEGTPAERVLKLDPNYLARLGVPLFRITEQRDGIAALAELATFFGFFLRLLLGLHIWSFRAPDKDTRPSKPIDFRPPAVLKIPGGGTVQAVRQTIVIGPRRPDLGGGKSTAKVLLTRYPNSSTAKRPLVMFHGYSAGGTTFAHHAVNPNFASYFWKTGRDVWIADLRISPALPTAVDAWSFDQVGAEDVTTVLKFVASQANGNTVDVIAHCMGAVYFSIAALSGKLGQIVDRVAFTQVGPLMVFTPANIFRAYVLRYLLEFLPDAYSFNPQSPTLADDLWDRVLSTLPYPIEEFDIENPVWPWKRTPWTRTRHRMDALYGRAFNAANMDPQTLRFINEHFGAMSLKTVSKTLHFVRYAMMTDFHGRNELVSREKFADHWNFPTLSIHGTDTGLTDPSTVDRMRKVLKDAGRVYDEPFFNKGAGHQDAVVGKPRHATMRRIEQFLDSNFPKAGTPDTEVTAYPPWIGPVLTVEPQQGRTALVIRLGAVPYLRRAEAVIMVRVRVDEKGIDRPDGLPWDLSYVTTHMMIYRSPDLPKDGWAVFEAPLPQSMPGSPGNAMLVLLAYAEDRVTPPFVPEFFYAVSKDGKVFEADHLRSNADPTKEIKEFKYRVFESFGQAALDRLVEGGRDLMDGVVPYDPPQAAPVGPLPSGTSFILASCQYPAGFVDAALAYRSYSRLGERVDAAKGIKPKFGLFVGDQVYVDPTAGLYDPAPEDDRYRLPYETWLREPSVRDVLRRIPSFMLLDDHEIDDNWEPLSEPDLECNQEKLRAGKTAFRKYQRGLNADLQAFEFDGYPFFILDTRTERSHRRANASLERAYLFQPGDNETMGKLKCWLKDSRPGPKFIVTPAMFLPRHRRAIQRDASLTPSNLSALHSDGWDGYPGSMAEVLGFIASQRIQHVVFLSGDEHRGCIATAQLASKDDGNLITTVHSIHTAAMYAPYPFANSIDEDIMERECFEFEYSAVAYGCTVTATRPPPGDGATFIFVRQDEGHWKLDYEFAGTVQTIVIGKMQEAAR
ncbi:alkaline phosphatase D family protein [Rhizobium leguminosarum]|uniref:alkaline phosphatase D family protein n=1 Tax=Rhizobium leguminosarum TaxID=384 RepID=UPI003F9909B7